MFAVRPGDNIVKNHVVFRLEPVTLCPAGREGIQHDDLRPRLNTNRRRVLPGDKNAELIHKDVRERGLLSVKELVFAIMKIRGNLRQVDTADSLIPMCRFR